MNSLSTNNNSRNQREDEVKIRDFWFRYLVAPNKQINIASREGKPYLWLRKAGDWIYLADHNGDFRAAKGDESIFKIMADWLNCVKAQTMVLNDFEHPLIVENIAYDKEKKFWNPIRQK